MLSCYPVTRPVRVTEPTLPQEPVTIAEARRQIGLGEDADQHDPTLQQLIVSARQQVEAAAAIVCYTGSFTWELSEFPGRDWLELPDIRPITSITSIAYVASDGTSTTWAASNYALKGALHPFVRLNYGISWPVVRGDIGGVTVTFVAGYATVAALPAWIKRAVLNRISLDWEDPSGSEKTGRMQAHERLIDLIRTESYS